MDGMGGPSGRLPSRREFDLPGLGRFDAGKREAGRLPLFNRPHGPSGAPRPILEEGRYVSPA